MAEQAITLLDHSKNPEKVTDNMTTLAATGAGNGFAIPYAKLGLVYLENPTGSNAAITIKGQQTAEQIARGITVGDETVTINTGDDPYTWYPHSSFKDANGNVIIEADQLIKVKAIKRITIS